MENSSSTVKTYNAMLKRLSKEVFKGKKIKELYLEQFQDKIFNYIDTMTLNSRNTMMGAIMNMIKQYEDFNEDVMDKYYQKWKMIEKEIRSQREKELTKPNKKDTDKILTIEQIRKLRDKIGAELTNTYESGKDIRYLILTLYSNPDLAPLRSQDYYQSKVVEDKEAMEKQTDKDKHNYLLLKEGLLYRNVGKTVKYHGTRVIAIPQDVLDVIKQFHDKSKSEWLIPNTVDITKPMEQSHFTKIMQRCIQQEYGKGKVISSSMVRKIKVSSEISKILKQYPQFEEMEQKLRTLAGDMGHTEYVQRAVYARLKSQV